MTSEGQMVDTQGVVHDEESWSTFLYMYCQSEGWRRQSISKTAPIPFIVHDARTVQHKMRIITVRHHHTSVYLTFLNPPYLYIARQWSNTGGGINLGTRLCCILNDKCWEGNMPHKVFMKWGNTTQVHHHIAIPLQQWWILFCYIFKW